MTFQPKLKWGSSIANRLVFHILLISSAVTLLATATQLYLYYHSDMDQLQSQMDQVDASFVRSITDDVWNIDFEQVQVHLNGILKLPDIEYVRVDPTDFDPIEAGSPPSGQQVVRKVPLYFERDGKRTYLGELTVAASLSGVYQRLYRKVLIVLVTQAIKTFLVSAFMLFIFNQIIIRHLEKIAAKARQFSLENPIEELVLDRKRRSNHDELEHVVTAFNQMQHALLVSYTQLLETNRELSDHKQNLENLVNERTSELRQAQQTLIQNAHQAGMAEIAIGVLHHIGNTLNSLNISAHVINETLKKSRIDRLGRANLLLETHKDDLAAFITQDPRGKKLLLYYLEIGKHLTRQHELLESEAEKLETFIKNIKDTIFSQQEYAHISSMTQSVDIAELLKEVIRLEQLSLAEAKIEVLLDLQPTPRIYAPVNKVRFVLQQLLKNARDAINQSQRSEPGTIRCQVEPAASGEGIVLRICDNGIGIKQHEIIDIFRSGYTTKEGSHGFGLHVCANIATEMGGSLSASSHGEQKGASFTLSLPPIAAQSAKAS